MIVHVDKDDGGVQAWFPDFPELIIPGDRLADTIYYGPYALQEHVAELRQKGQSVPEPTTPDLRAIYDKNPEALIGFVAIDESGNNPLIRSFEQRLERLKRAEAESRSRPGTTGEDLRVGDVIIAGSENWGLGCLRRAQNRTGLIRGSSPN